MALRTCNTSTVLVSNLNEVVKDSASKFGSHCRFCCFFSLFLLALNIDMQDVGKKFVTQLTQAFYHLHLFVLFSKDVADAVQRADWWASTGSLYHCHATINSHTSFILHISALSAREKEKEDSKEKKKLLIGKWASLTSLACAYVISLCKSPCEWPFPWLNCHC